MIWSQSRAVGCLLEALIITSRPGMLSNKREVLSGLGILDHQE